MTMAFAGMPEGCFPYNGWWKWVKQGYSDMDDEASFFQNAVGKVM
jgi:hypothetical protein